MSGGVDSAVAAAILKDQGCEVVGLFLHLWKEKKMPSKDYVEFKRICKKLKIKSIAVNTEKEFKKKIVDYFLLEYEKGRTPNPCVICNSEIKFKIFLEKMLEMKADYVATGHYVRINKQQVKSKKRKFICKLFEAKDKNKDQSYFLYGLKQKQLAKIIFPLGEMKKDEVRKLAKKLKLSVHDKKESQDVCFIFSSTENFLKDNLKLKSGKIINQKGKIIGSHLGLPLYTCGQRKGINVGGDGPYYVSGKDFKKNILIATNQKEDPNLFREEILLEKINWISEEKIKFPLEIKLRTRYRNPLVSAIIKSYSIKHETYIIVFNEPQKNITPGQSAVFYSDKGEVLGGGIIK